MAKKLKNCAVNGYLGRYGKYFAMCPHVNFGDKSLCCAHGNKKCEHMIKQGEKEQC